MADHVIIQARDAIITKLKAGVSAVSNRVYKFGEVEFESVDEANSPFILVQLGDDTEEIVGINSADSSVLDVLEDMRPTIFVHCIAKQSGDAEATAYNLRRDVESTLFATQAARTLDGKVQGVYRIAAANNREDALDLGAYSSVLQLEVHIRHLDRLPDSFTY